MRAAVCQKLGSLSDVVVAARDDPVPGPGQAVVEVRAAGANFVDGLMCEGKYQIRIEAPFVPGSEVSGVVSAVGSPSRGEESLQGPGVEVGQRVMVSCGFGGFAEKVAVPVASLFPIPDGLDFARAATFIQSYCTVWFALTRRVALTEGETVLVLGAGGGIGLACVDVARALGATVIAAASDSARLGAARAAGATAVINYVDEDLKVRARELSGGGVDVVVDPVGASQSEPALRALRPFGRMCVIGFAAGGIPTVPLNQVLLNNRTVAGVDWGAWAMRNPAANRELLLELVGLVASRRLHPVEPAERPLEDAAEVMSALLDRRVSGKVVLVP